MKFTKTHERQIKEFMSVMDTNGCVVLEDWVSGNYARHKTPKALPPFVKRYEKKNYDKCGKPQHGTPERAAMEFFEDHPKRKAVLVIDQNKLFEFLFNCARLQEMN